MSKKLKNKVKNEKKKLPKYKVEEDIEEFFPKVSHMGIAAPSRWEQTKHFVYQN